MVASGRANLHDRSGRIGICWDCHLSLVICPWGFGVGCWLLVISYWLLVNFPCFPRSPYS
ncbi:MAG: hypothetical protein D6728_10885 [Cyanobacteria bacterium J055]|nr:MAG: hypothetical protein D6728_10885 [Cyanobacteria bacterium J055]